MKGVLVLFAWMILSSAQAQTPESGFYKREVLRNDGIASIYQVYVPLGYTAEKEWPVILFLNGYGEQGEDGEKQVGTGLGPALQNHPESWPAESDGYSMAWGLFRNGYACLSTDAKRV